MQRVRPSSTLKTDAFDAPAPQAVSEAQKAGGGGADHSAHGQQQNVTYTCPMHPEVVSDKPGTCPKCGMALVEKKK